MKDIIDFEIMADGVIKIRTDKVSAANHVSADQLMELIRDAAGGETTTEKRKDAHHHHHHGHTHTH